MKKFATKESDIQKAIKDYLLLIGAVVVKHRNVGIRKPDGGFIPVARDEIGAADLVACVPPNGKYLAVECKNEKGKPTPAQLDFLERVKTKGGIAVLARSIDDVRDALQKDALKDLSRFKSAIC